MLSPCPKFGGGIPRRLGGLCARGGAEGRGDTSRPLLERRSGRGGRRDRPWVPSKKVRVPKVKRQCQFPTRGLTLSGRRPEGGHPGRAAGRCPLAGDDPALPPNPPARPPWPHPLARGHPARARSTTPARRGDPCPPPRALPPLAGGDPVRPLAAGDPVPAAPPRPLVGGHPVRPLAPSPSPEDFLAGASRVRLPQGSVRAPRRSPAAPPRSEAVAGDPVLRPPLPLGPRSDRSPTGGSQALSHGAVVWHSGEAGGGRAGGFAAAVPVWTTARGAWPFDSPPHHPPDRRPT